MRIRWLGMMMEHELINPQRSDKLSIFNMRNCKEYLEKMLPLSASYDIKRLMGHFLGISFHNFHLFHHQSL